MLEQSQFPNVLMGVEERVLTLILSGNEGKPCTLTDSVIGQLKKVLAHYRNDDSIRCLIITGVEETFVAGANIRQILELTADAVGEKSGREFSRIGHELMDMIANYPKPVIAAINGHALGAGCELAMACHIRVAAKLFKANQPEAAEAAEQLACIGQPEINLGLIPGYGGTQRLPRHVDRGFAYFMMLTGDPITAEQAYQRGLVQKICLPGDLLPAATGIAKKICAKSPLIVRYLLEAINRGRPDLSVGLRHEIALFQEVCGTADKGEGCTAFMEKRKPVFTGR